VLDGGPVTEVGAALGLMLVCPKRLQEGFLRMDGERAPAARRGRACRALPAGLTDRRGKVDRGRADADRGDLLGRTDDARGGEPREWLRRARSDLARASSGTSHPRRPLGGRRRSTLPWTVGARVLVEDHQKAVAMARAVVSWASAIVAAQLSDT